MVFVGQTHLVHDTKWAEVVGPLKFTNSLLSDHGVHCPFEDPLYELQNSVCEQCRFLYLVYKATLNDGCSSSSASGKYIVMFICNPLDEMKKDGRQSINTQPFSKRAWNLTCSRRNSPGPRWCLSNSLNSILQAPQPYSLKSSALSNYPLIKLPALTLEYTEAQITTSIQLVIFTLYGHRFSH